MKLLAFCVRDLAVDTFLPPFFCRHTGEAMRSFTEACGDRSHQFAKHRSDYVLFQLGVWDDVSGLFEAGEPRRIMSGLEAVGEAPAS